MQYDNLGLLRANIVVAGITGSGKSTLINAVFGKELAMTGTGKPVTHNIVEYGSADIPVRIWDTVGLELDDETRNHSIEEIKQTILKKNDSEDIIDRIHAIWYCINSATARYQQKELDFIKSLYSIKVPFIIILTKCVDDEEVLDEFEKSIREINNSHGIDDINIIRILAEDYSSRIGIIPKFGLDELVSMTMKKLPVYIKSGFIAAQNVNMLQKRVEAEKTICEVVKQAKTGFWNNLLGNVPLVNLLTTEGKIRGMFWKLAKLYNDDLPQKEIIKIWEDVFSKIEILKGLAIPLIDFGSFRKKLDDIIVENKFNPDDVIGELAVTEQAALILAYFGYLFIISIEKLWQAKTEAKLKGADDLIAELIEEINRMKLNDIINQKS